MKTKILLLSLIALTACKTRKVQTDITSTSKSTNTEQNSQVRRVDTNKTVDKSIEQSNSLKTAENTSTTEFEADSIVQKGDRTIIYPKGPIKTISTGHSTTTKNKTKQNDIETTSNKSLDSSGTFKQAVKQDSTHKAKIVDAKGSGTVLAMWIGGGIALALILAVVLYSVRKKP